ncbi:MAG TPA: ABC transporter permease, partial [Chitinophagaceae bacterium]|nr:ABC transporter permease [Chitinophagaceae bacterium]
MIRNYFKTLFRNLTRQKVPAVINILGLSAGIACFSLFMLYAINEFNYDSFHKNENIYRVFLWHEAKGNEPPHGDTYHPMPLGPAMKQDLPDVENYVRFREATNESFIKVNNKVVREKVVFADPSFFSVFSFKLTVGSPVTALQDLHSVVITEAAAKNLFGKTDPLGKTIEIKTEDKFEQFIITAIAANPPGNSSIQFKLLGNFNYLTTTPSAPGRINNWRRYSYQTYVQLKPGSHLPSDKNTLVSFRKKYYPDEEARSRKDGWMGKGARTYLGLQPLTAIHTDTRISGGSVVPVETKTIWILLGIAAGILIIACINFTTLAIGRSAGRSKEVGVRKVIGSSKISLIKQFLFEAFLLAFISAVFGILLAKALLPYFNKLSERDLNFSITQFPQLLWLLTGVVILTALIAGSYPALVLSSFKPVEVLKTKIRLGGSNIFTRSLVTLQFVLSIGLIISTIVILQQLRYMQAKHPGFNKENVMVIDADGIPDTKNLYALFKHKLAGHPEIIGSAGADLGLGGEQEWSYAMFRYNGSDKKVYEYFIDPDYLRVLGMKLLTGRNFKAEIVADTVSSVIINEAMMNNFGWTLQNAVGQKVKG